MRALCASIITAGALIGLGLVGIGLGLRYHNLALDTNNPVYDYVRLRHLDTPMMLILVFLLAMALVGIASTFVGLAYHHERRHHERHHLGRGEGESLRSRLGE
jgi:hypothetical protein